MIPIDTKEEVVGYRLIVGYIGVLMMLIGGIVLLPLFTLLFYPQDIKEIQFFLAPGIGAILLGYLLFFNIKGKKKGKLQRNQDAIIVVLCWMLAIFITALPFYLSGSYNLTQAIFETTSGWSTTGLSVVDVDHTSHLFLMHRSLILFFGGVGLVLVMLSVLSDSYGMRLYSAEGHSDRLLPNLVKSARIILTIYFSYTVGGIILYMFFGMNLFDAIIHSIGALSTGGFSSHSQSIAYYDSVWIETITIVLMILGNINFLAHLFLIRGKFKNFFRYCEIRLSFVLIGVATPLIALLMMGSLQTALPDAFRHSLFQVVSALTTTGFQTIPSFHVLPSSILLILIVLQLIGGGIGSTAGGIKQYRIFVMCKSVYWKIKSMLYSNNVVHSHKIYKVNQKEPLSEQEISHVGVYTFLYLCIFALGSFILCCYGYSLQDSMFDFSSALSTVGLSTGIMSFDAPSPVLWVGTTGMFIGRLEIYVVFLAILRFGKDIKRNIRKKGHGDI